jgi:hypothetical protein
LVFFVFDRLRLGAHRGLRPEQQQMLFALAGARLLLAPELAGVGQFGLPFRLGGAVTPWMPATGAAGATSRFGGRPAVAGARASHR